MNNIKQEFNLVTVGPKFCQIIKRRIMTNQVAPHSTLTKKADLADAIKHLIDSGFHREEGDYIKRDCKHCHSCMPARISVQDFQPNRNLRRVLRDNADVNVERVNTYDIAEHLDLFNYHRLCRKLSEYSLRPEEMEAMIRNPYTGWGILEARLNGELVAACLFDEFDDRIQGNQFYYDVALSEKRSLGKLMVLKCIEHAASLSKDYVYIGAVTQEKSKLRYKELFKPEVRRDDRWQASEPQP